MVLGNVMAKKHPLLPSSCDIPSLTLSHPAITSISHSPSQSLSPTHRRSSSHLLPLRALDECCGLIAFFGERISMSCRECSGLMHKEQAARAQKMGGRGFADTSSFNQLVKLWDRRGSKTASSDYT